MVRQAEIDKFEVSVSAVEVYNRVIEAFEYAALRALWHPEERYFCLLPLYEVSALVDMFFGGRADDRLQKAILNFNELVIRLEGDKEALLLMKSQVVRHAATQTASWVCLNK